MVVMALDGLKGDLSGHYYGLGDMTEKEQQQLIDVGHVLSVLRYWVGLGWGWHCSPCSNLTVNVSLL